MTLSAESNHGSLAARSDLVRALRAEPVSRTPVWFMRQAGRSLPEYRAARAGTAMLDACQEPDLVAEITLQPVRRHGVDAAIFFSDIVVPLRAIGIEVEIQPGIGPVIAEPISSAADLARLRPLGADDVEFVTEAIRLLVAELGPTPLIGFAGAPFTLASYLVEGGPSRTHGRTKAMMHEAPELWRGLCERLAAISLEFLRVQVRAGAAAIQLFDSWAGCLTEADYRRAVLPHSRRIFAGLTEFGVPRIHFGVGTGHLLTAMAEAGSDAVGIDWRTPLDTATELANGKVLQGNLDPALLLADRRVLKQEVTRILTEAKQAPGHVFNLGHGVLPETDPGELTYVTDLVHELGQR